MVMDVHDVHPLAHHGRHWSPLVATGRHWSQVDVACGDVQISSTRSPGMSPVTSLMLGEVSVETFQLTQTARSSPTGLQ